MQITLRTETKRVGWLLVKGVVLTPILSELLAAKDTALSQSQRVCCEVMTTGRDFALIGCCEERTIHKLSKFKEEDILRIRAKYANGDATQVELAAEYHCKQPIISAIVNRKTWKHI
jgi:hypothetical protein